MFSLCKRAREDGDKSKSTGLTKKFLENMKERLTFPRAMRDLAGNSFNGASVFVAFLVIGVVASRARRSFE